MWKKHFNKSSVSYFYSADKSYIHGDEGKIEGFAFKKGKVYEISKLSKVIVYTFTYIHTHTNIQTKYS